MEGGEIYYGLSVLSGPGEEVVDLAWYEEGQAGMTVVGTEGLTGLVAKHKAVADIKQQKRFRNHNNGHLLAPKLSTIKAKQFIVSIYLHASTSTYHQP